VESDRGDQAHDDDEPLELTEELEPGDEPEEQPGDDNPDDQPDDDGEETVSVGFEGEEPDEPETNTVVRTMRQQLRDKEKRIKELERAAAPKPIEVGEKPTLASCDYDEESYEQQLDAWKDRKAQAERQNQTQAEQSRKASEEWQADLASFEAKKASLSFRRPRRGDRHGNVIAQPRSAGGDREGRGGSCAVPLRARQVAGEDGRDRQAGRPDKARGRSREDGRSSQSDDTQGAGTRSTARGSASMPGNASKELESLVILQPNSRIQRPPAATGETIGGEMIRLRPRMS
jgi:hypothetical protein